MAGAREALGSPLASVRTYAPLFAVVVLQAAFVLVAPSTGENRVNRFPQAADASPGASSRDTPGSASTDEGGGTGIGTIGSVESGRGPQASTPAAGAASRAAGDTSHCRGGRQTDVIYQAPPCVAKFPVGADNGGATYRGVTAKEIRLAAVHCPSHPQLTALTASQGLSATNEEVDAMIQAATKFINRRYETYGRTLVSERIEMDCPTQPPDTVERRQAAEEVAQRGPMFVLVLGGGTPSAEVFAEHGIISIGINGSVNAYYAGRRPFRWDQYSTAEDTAAFGAEYYCRQLARKPASNAGRLIHPSIGGRDTPRKLGVVVPDYGDGANVPGAEALSAAVRRCGGGDVPVFTYQPDVTRATEIARVIVAGMIDAKVTTVAWMTEPLSPIVLTPTMTENSYFPEHLLTGMGLTDYDPFPRLYDSAQWTHAFGLSQLADTLSFDDTDAARVWRDSGYTGRPCELCDHLVMSQMNMFGTMIQNAGPNLNPGTVEAGLVGSRYSRGGWAATGGNRHVFLTKYGPGDYNAISDVREVYWDGARLSGLDGEPGSYVSMNGGKRYQLGELDRSFDIPAKRN